MAPHSSTFVWKIPWMEEPGRLQSMGLLESDMTTRLRDFTFTFHFHALEKEMATHSSVLAWTIPGTVEPDGLLSMGSHRVVPWKRKWQPTPAQSVQSLSHVRLFATPWTACQVSLSITNSWSLLTLMSIELVMPSNHLILCHPLSSCLQSFPASGLCQ